MLDADENNIPTAGATYYVVVWLQAHESSKLGIALGTWVEDFRTAYDIATPTCTRTMRDYAEMWFEQPESFPVVACDGEGSSPPVVNPKLPPTCEEEGTCDTPCAPFVEYGLPPANEKERLKVVQKMAA